jgi:hypothetical protein
LLERFTSSTLDVGLASEAAKVVDYRIFQLFESSLVFVVQNGQYYIHLNYLWDNMKAYEARKFIQKRLTYNNLG